MFVLIVIYRAIYHAKIIDNLFLKAYNKVELTNIDCHWKTILSLNKNKHYHEMFKYIKRWQEYVLLSFYLWIKVQLIF